MLTNAQMIPNRFARMAKARKIRRMIEACLATGGKVQVSTYTRSVLYSSPDHFRFDRFSAYVRRGRKAWDCIDGCHLRFWNGR